MMWCGVVGVTGLSSHKVLVMLKSCCSTVGYCSTFQYMYNTSLSHYVAGTIVRAHKAGKQPSAGLIKHHTSRGTSTFRRPYRTGEQCSMLASRDGSVLTLIHVWPIQVWLSTVSVMPVNYSLLWHHVIQYFGTKWQC